jgi:hypothetical protein
MGTNTFGACRCICGETTVTVESGSLEHRAQVLSLALTIETGAIHWSEPTYANPETFQIGTGRAVYNAADDLVARNQLAFVRAQLAPCDVITSSAFATSQYFHEKLGGTGLRFWQSRNVKRPIGQPA